MGDSDHIEWHPFCVDCASGCQHCGRRQQHHEAAAAAAPAALPVALCVSAHGTCCGSCSPRSSSHNQLLQPEAASAPACCSQALQPVSLPAAARPTAAVTQMLRPRAVRRHSTHLPGYGGSSSCSSSCSTAHSPVTLHSCRPFCQCLALFPSALLLLQCHQWLCAYGHHDMPTPQTLLCCAFLNFCRNSCPPMWIIFLSVSNLSLGQDLSWFLWRPA